MFVVSCFFAVYYCDVGLVIVSGFAMVSARAGGSIDVTHSSSPLRQ